LKSREHNVNNNKQTTFNDLELRSLDFSGLFRIKVDEVVEDEDIFLGLKIWD